MENISTLENSSSIVSVTLRENHFSKDGTYYGVVTRNKATFKNILSEIAEDNKGIDPYMLQYAAILIQKKILKLLEQGKAVNILDIGTLYISIKCKAKSINDVPESGNFDIGFTPTSLAKDSLKNLSVDKVVIKDSSPEIFTIKDISVNSEEGILTIGGCAKVTGAKLKIGTDELCGIYFAPCDETEEIAEDESTWTKLEYSAIFRNTPTELNILIPNSLESTKKYRIVIRTNYISKKQKRKEIVETISDIFSVKASN